MGFSPLVGLHSYLPYMAVLALLHVAAAGGAFVLLARRLPGWAALLAVLPLLVLGSGYEDILWAFQIGFVASVAAGTWGLVALETDQRRWTAIAGTALLIVGLASSGMGIFFVVAAAVRLFVDPAFRRRSIWVVVPGAVFAVWYLAFGRHGAGGGFASPVAVLRFAARGLTFAVGRVAGFDLAGRIPLLGWVAGAAALLLVVVVLARGVMGRLVAPLALGGVVAATAMYIVIGLTRADLLSDFATRSRYVYVAAFLLIPAAGDLIASLSTGRRLPRAAVIGLVALAFLSVGANVLDLRAGRAQFAANAGLTRAYLTVLAEHPGTHGRIRCFRSAGPTSSGSMGCSGDTDLRCKTRSCRRTSSRRPPRSSSARSSGSQAVRSRRRPGARPRRRSRRRQPSSSRGARRSPRTDRASRSSPRARTVG